MTEPKTNDEEMVHGTCVAINGHGVLLIGPSGSGKSDCALRLLDEGAMLVADDQTILTPDNEETGLIATAPTPIKGMMEIRGIGIVRWESVDAAPLKLVIAACDADQEPRMPEFNAGDDNDDNWATYCTIRTPQFRFDLRHAAAPAKIRTALGVVTNRHRLIT